MRSGAPHSARGRTTQCAQAHHEKRSVSASTRTIRALDEIAHSAGFVIETTLLAWPARINRFEGGSPVA